MVRHLLHKVPKSLHHTGLHHQRTQLTWQRKREGRGGRRGGEWRGREGGEERGRGIEGCDGNWGGGE